MIEVTNHGRCEGSTDLWILEELNYVLDACIDFEAELVIQLVPFTLLPGEEDFRSLDPVCVDRQVMHRASLEQCAQ